jgi:hypothetical protein
MIRGLIGAVVGLAVMVVAGYAAAVVYINNDGRRLAELYFKPWGGRGKVTFGAVEKSLFDDKLTISDVAVRAPDGRTYKIARIVVRDYDWLNLRHPRYADVVVQKAETTPAGLGPVYGPPVKAAGLDRLIASAHYRYRYEDETKQFIIETVRVDFQGLGVLTMSARFQMNRYPDFGKFSDPTQLLQFSSSTKLIGARASFRNQALVQRIVQSYAAANGIAPDQAKERILKDLGRERRHTKDAIKKEALGAAMAFVEKPGVIEAVAAPASEISLMRASWLLAFNQKGFKSMLGLSIRAKPPSAEADAAPKR